MIDLPYKYDHEFVRMLLNLPESRNLLTKSQQAYAQVRKAIVAHEVPANTALDEHTLLTLFPVGRTPLRESLKWLTHEGLLSWPPHQAPTIRDINIAEMNYLYETRRLLEPEIASLAARRSTPSNHIEIERFRAGLEDASAKGDVYASVEFDFALHSSIARATQSRFLTEASDHLNRQSLRIWYRAQSTHGVSSVNHLHSALVDAITQGDAQKSEELAIVHIENSLSRQRSLLHGNS